MKNLGVLILFLLVFVIFLSGCIGQTNNTGVSTGVIIKSFTTDFAEIYPGEPVTLYITVQNVGDVDATGTTANLMVLNPAEWASPTANSFNEIKIGNLAKAIPSQNIPGDEWTDEWDLTAPSINTNQHTFTAGVRVKYTYETKASATLEFLTNNYIKSLKPDQQDAAKKSSGLISQSCSNAPISVSFAAGTRPFVVYGDSGNFLFQIIVNNVGQGNPYDPGANDKLYQMTISKPNIAGENIHITCPILEQKEYKILLPRGTSKAISCTVSATDINNILDGNVNVTLSYSYLVDASTTINVIQQS